MFQFYQAQKKKFEYQIKGIKKCITYGYFKEFVVFIYHMLEDVTVKKIKDKGYGLIAKKNINIERYLFIFGWIDPGCFYSASNLPKKHGSIININNKWYPLYGPISILNHQCERGFEFELIGDEIMLNKVRQHIKLQLKHNNPIPTKDYVFVINKNINVLIKENEEITVDYKVFFKDCACDFCKKRVPSIKSTEFVKEKYNDFVLEEDLDKTLNEYGY